MFDAEGTPGGSSVPVRLEFRQDGRQASGKEWNEWCALRRISKRAVQERKGWQRSGGVV